MNKRNFLRNLPGDSFLSSKLLWFVIILNLVTLVIAGASFQRATYYFSSQATPENLTNTVRIIPSTITIPKGGSAVVAVRIEQVNYLWGAQTYINYDPSIIEVLKLDDAGFLAPDFGIKKIAAGQLKYVYAQNGQLRQPVSGSGDWFMITFRGLKEGCSPLKFNKSSPNITKLVNTEGNLIGKTTTRDGIVIVGTSTTCSQ